MTMKVHRQHTRSQICRGFGCKNKQMLVNDSSHRQAVVTFTANLVNDYLWNRKKILFVFAFMPEVLEGGKRGKNGKEGFHGSSRRRVSVVKPNIRDSIPNTEPSMRVCHPRKIENICHPLQAPACFYKSGRHNPLCSCLRFYSHVIQRRKKKKHVEQKKRWWAVLEVNV